MLCRNATSGVYLVVFACVAVAFHISSLADISYAQHRGGAVHCRGCEHAFQPIDGLFGITRPESLRASVIRRTEFLRIGSVETRLYWLAQVSPVVDDDNSVALSSLETWLRSGRNPATAPGSHGQGALSGQYFPGRPRGNRGAPVRVLFFKHSQESAVDTSSTLPLYALKQQPWLLDISWFRGFIPRPVFCPVCSSFLGWEFIPWGFSRHSGVSDTTEMSDYVDIVDLLASTGSYSTNSHAYGKLDGGHSGSATTWDTFSSTRKPFFALFADELLFSSIPSESPQVSSGTGLSLVPLAQFLQPPEFEWFRRIFRIKQRQASLRDGVKEDSDLDATGNDLYNPNGRELVHVAEPSVFLAGVWVESPARLVVLRAWGDTTTRHPRRQNVSRSLDVEIEVLRERIDAMRHHLAQWRRIVRRLPIFGDAMNLLVLEPASMLTDGLKVLIDDLGSAVPVEEIPGSPETAEIEQIGLGKEGRLKDWSEGRPHEVQHQQKSQPSFSATVGRSSPKRITSEATENFTPGGTYSSSVNESRTGMGSPVSGLGKEILETSTTGESTVIGAGLHEANVTTLGAGSGLDLFQQQIGNQHMTSREPGAVPSPAAIDRSVENVDFSGVDTGASTREAPNNALDAMVTASVIARVSWTLVQVVQVICVAATEVTFYPMSRQFILDVQHVRRNSNAWVGLLVAVATIVQFVLSWVLFWRLVIVPLSTKLKRWLVDRLITFFRRRNHKKRKQQQETESGPTRCVLGSAALRERNHSRRQMDVELGSANGNVSAMAATSSWSSIANISGPQIRRRRVLTYDEDGVTLLPRRERRHRRRWEERQLARNAA